MNSKFAQMFPKQAFKLNFKTIFLFTSLTLAVGASRQTAFASEYKNVLDPSIREKLSGQTIFKKDTTGINYLHGLKVKILIVDESRDDYGQLVLNSVTNNGEIDGAIYKREIGTPYEIQFMNPVSVFNDLQKEEITGILNGEFKWGRPAERRGSVMSVLGWSYFYKQDSNHHDKPNLVLFLSKNNALTTRQQDYINICLQKNINYLILSGGHRESTIQKINEKIFEAIEANYFDYRLDTQFKNGEKKGYEDGYIYGKAIASLSNSLDVKEAYEKGYREGRLSVSTISTSTFESNLKSQQSFEKGKQQGSKIKDETMDKISQNYGEELMKEYKRGFAEGEKKGYISGANDERANQELVKKLSNQ